MKKIFIPFLAFLALSVLPSCSEKFKIAAPYKNVTVVYGLLDQADTAHYIRIQKAFLDDNKSAVSMSKEPDSNFYANISVVMKSINMFTGNVTEIIPLTRVDLNQEGYPKQTGLFFDAPNYAYKFKKFLDSSLIYRLVITNNLSGEVDSADAPIIADTKGGSFYVKMLDDTVIGNNGLSFNSLNTSATVSNLSGYYRPPYLFTFEGYSTPVALVQGTIRFNWVDSNMNTNVKTPQHYDYDLGYNTLNDINFNYRPKDVDLVNAIANGMGPAPQFIVRLMDSCDLTFYLGTYDFNTYLQVQQLQGVGLTGNEIQPVYTNLKGSKAIGLYTSRAMRTGKITIDNSAGGTISFLDTCSVTASARIRGTIYH